MVDSDSEREQGLSEEDDGTEELGTEELDKKVEEALRGIAEFTATAPEKIVKMFDPLMKEYPNVNWAELFKLAYAELPKWTSIIENWTTSLSAYATYRSLRKQEALTQRILRSNQILAGATVILAVATFVLVLVDILHV